MSPEQMDAFKQMAVQVNDGLSQVVQVLGKMDQAAGGEMADLQKGYQGIVQSALGGGGQAKDPNRPAEAGTGEVRQAY